MIKFENTAVYGWEEAIRGMRNPLNSWEKSDSEFGVIDDPTHDGSDGFIRVAGDGITGDYIGPKDKALMMTLRNAGTDHRKFMRTIAVYVDITAPLYWWKEFDTYKVGTVANSCSTMHTIHKKEFDISDFSCEHLIDETFTGEVIPEVLLEATIKCLNENRVHYLSTKDKKYWWQMIQLLPTSYNQKRTVMLNYEVLANIYKSRKDHKLDEWHEFCCWIHSLPCSSLIAYNDWLYLVLEEVKKIDPRVAKVEISDNEVTNRIDFIFRDRDDYILYIPNITKDKADPADIVEDLKEQVEDCVEFQNAASTEIEVL